MDRVKERIRRRAENMVLTAQEGLLQLVRIHLLQEPEERRFARRRILPCTPFLAKQ